VLLCMEAHGSYLLVLTNMLKHTPLTVDNAPFTLSIERFSDGNISLRLTDKSSTFGEKPLTDVPPTLLPV
jgi:hypothetical protein